MKNSFAKLLAAIQSRLVRSCADAQGSLSDYVALERRVLFSAAPIDVETLEPEVDAFEGTADSGVDLFDDAAWSDVGDFDAATYSATSESKSLVVIDGAVENLEILIKDLERQHSAGTFEVVLLDAEVDGVAQITEAIHDVGNVSALHLVSHGENGQVQLGATALSSETLDQFASQIATWNTSLEADADILIYGCDVTSSAAGEELVESLHILTGAGVAASDDVTGHVDLGGDWDFEFVAGVVETDVAFSADVQQSWVGALATVTVTRLDDTVNGTTTSVAALINDDGGDGISLREAILAVNAGNGGDTILLGPGRHNLTRDGVSNSQGDLDLLENVTIIGASDGSTIIDANGLDRVIEVHNGTSTIRDVTIEGGFSTTGEGGGAIRIGNADTLILESVVVEGNESTAKAGGISVSGTLVLRNSTVRNNISGGDGGGLSVNSGRIIIENSTFSSNEAESGRGGAIDIVSSSGQPHLLTNVTLSGNSALEGGGIAVGTVDVSATHVTIAENFATTGGGVFWDSGAFIVENSIIANNTAVTGQEVFGEIESNGANIIGDDLGDSNFGSGYDPVTDLQDQTGLSLGALVNNGGSIQTHELLAGSVGIDGGTSALTTDGRGFLRTDGANDIGAFERGAVGATPTTIVVDTVADYGVSSADYGDTSSISSLLGDKGADGLVSLREAIDAANNTTGFNTIEFNIAGAPVGGAHTISVLSQLQITDTVHIDGMSEPDASFGADGLARPVIELNGGGLAIDGLELVAASAGSIIEGLVINNFAGSGIEARTSDNTFIGNFIGTDATGTLSQGNSNSGILVIGGSNNVIGGSSAGQANIIAGNGGDGIQLFGVDTFLTDIFGNYIGADITGSGLGNSGSGVNVEFGANDNQIGGLISGQGNLIIANGGDGISVGSTSLSTQILGNSIYANADQAIDLNDDGATANDPQDLDAGGNNLQNYPVITDLVVGGATTAIQYDTSSAEPGTYTIQFFASDANGQARRLLQTVSGVTPAAGQATIVSQVLTDGEYVTAIATEEVGNNPVGDSSEVSLGFQYVLDNSAPTFVELDGSPTFVEGGIAVTLDANVGIVDQELTSLDDFGGTSLTIQRSGGFDSDDVFTTTGNLVFNGSGLELSMNVVGTVTQLAGQLALTFNAGISNSQVNEVMRSIEYSNASDTPPSQVDLEWVFSDGNDGIAQGAGPALTAVGTTTVNISAVDVVPSIDLNGANVGVNTALDFTENDGPTNIAPLAVVNDLGEGDITSINLDALGFQANGSPELILVNGDVLTGGMAANDTVAIANTVFSYQYDGGDAIIFANASGAGVPLPAADVELLIRSIQYQNLSNDPNAGDIDFEFTIQDLAGQNSLTATSVVTVIPVNDPPVVDLDGGTASGNDFLTSFAEGDSPVVASGFGATINDVDSLELSGLSITLNGFVDGGDEVLFVGGEAFQVGVQEIVNVTFGSTQFEIDNDGGALNISVVGGGTAAVGEFEGLLQTLEYQHVSQTPTSGNRTLSITASDAEGGVSAVATSTIAVGALNDPPLAVADTLTTNEDIAFSNNVLTNDNDLDGDLLVVNTVPLAGPTNGSLVLLADGAFTYTPNADFFGTDSFTYEVNDGNGGLDQATVTITVNPVNDAPVLTAGTVVDLFVNEDSGLTSLGLGGLSHSPGGGPEATQSLIYNVTVVPSPLFGSVFLADGVTAVTTGTYTLSELQGMQFVPVADETGITFFEFEVVDDGGTANGGSDTTTHSIQITVDPVNDAPVANDDGFSTSEDVPFSSTLGINDLLSNDSDIEGDALTVNTTPVTAPANGTLVLNSNGTYTYTPNANFHGTDSFIYEVFDGNGGVGQATVSIVIDSVNDAPTATGDSYATGEDVAFTSILGSNDLLQNDTDIDADPLTVVGIPVSGPTDGSLVLNSDGTFTYTPNAGFVGTDSFVYEVSDGNGGTGQATADITVAQGVFAADDEFTTLTNQPVNDSVASNDVVTPSSVLAVVNTPANGTVTLNSDGTFTYIPDNGFVGIDSFQYELSDENGSDIGTVVIEVLPPAVVAGPLANADVFISDEGQILTDSVAENDVVTSPSTATYSLVNASVSGSVSLNDDGTFTYTHDGSETTTDSFEYRVEDLNGNLATATATIQIAPVNDAPIAVDDEFSIVEGASIGGSLVTNDTDAEGDALFVTLVSGPSHGSLTLTPNGGFTYVHDGLEVSVDSFVYELTDAGGLSSTANVNLAISSINDAPIANADSLVTMTGQSILIEPVTLLANDFDAEGMQLDLNLVSGPTNGSIVPNPDGSFTYTPQPGFQGVDSFTYAASDGETLSSPITVLINVAVAPVGAPLPTGFSDAGGTPDPGNTFTENSGDGDSLDDIVDMTETSTSAGTDDDIAPPPINYARRNSLAADSGFEKPQGPELELVEVGFQQVNSSQRIDLANSGLDAAAESLVYRLQQEIPNLLANRGHDLIGELKGAELMWENIDLLRDQINDSLEQRALNVGAATAVTGVATFGYLLWTIRGGHALIAALVASGPSWKMLDPLPVMAMGASRRSQEDDSSLAELAKKSNSKQKRP